MNIFLILPLLGIFFHLSLNIFEFTQMTLVYRHWLYKLVEYL
jgi:hypothetical protein